MRGRRFCGLRVVDLRPRHYRQQNALPVRAVGDADVVGAAVVATARLVGAWSSPAAGPPACSTSDSPASSPREAHAAADPSASRRAGRGIRHRVLLECWCHADRREPRNSARFPNGPTASARSPMLRANAVIAGGPPMVCSNRFACGVVTDLQRRLAQLGQRHLGACPRLGSRRIGHDGRRVDERPSDRASAAPRSTICNTRAAA